MTAMVQQKKVTSNQLPILPDYLEDFLNRTIRLLYDKQFLQESYSISKYLLFPGNLLTGYILKIYSKLPSSTMNDSLIQRNYSNWKRMFKENQPTCWNQFKLQIWTSPLPGKSWKTTIQTNADLLPFILKHYSICLPYAPSHHLNYNPFLIQRQMQSLH